MPYLVLTEDAVQCMLEPPDFYPARPLYAVANLVRKHASQFNGLVYLHIFGDQLLISMNEEEFRLQNQIMLSISG